MVSVGSVGWETYIDLSGFDKDLATLNRQARQFNAEIAIAVDSSGIEDLNDQLKALETNYTRTARRIGGTPLKPRVDASELHDLNDLYDEKIKHHDQVNDHFERNPITPKVDLTELDNAIARIGEFQTSGSGSNEIQMSFNVDSSGIADTIIEDLEKGIANAGDSLNKAITAPFTSIATGVFEGVGRSMGDAVGDAFKVSVESVIGGVFENIGNAAGTAIGSVLKNVDSQIGTNVLQQGKTQNTSLIDLPNGADLINQLVREMQAAIALMDPVKIPVNIKEPVAQTAGGDVPPPRKEAAAVAQRTSLPPPPPAQFDPTAETKRRIAQITSGISTAAKEFQKSNTDIIKATRILKSANTSRGASEDAIAEAINTINRATAFARTVRENAERATKDLDQLIANLPSDQQGMASRASREKALLSRRQNQAEEFLNVRLPKFEAQAQNIGREISAGISQSGAETIARQAGEQIGRAAVEGTEDALGIESPSKQYLRIMMQIAAGIKLGTPASLAAFEQLTIGIQEELDRTSKAVKGTDIVPAGNKQEQRISQAMRDRLLSGAEKTAADPNKANLQQLEQALAVLRKYGNQETKATQDNIKLLKQQIQLQKELNRENEKRKQDLSAEGIIKNPGRAFDRFTGRGDEQRRQDLQKQLGQRRSIEDEVKDEILPFMASLASFVVPAAIPITSFLPLVIPLIPAIIAAVGVSTFVSNFTPRIQQALDEVVPVRQRFNTLAGPEQGPEEFQYVRGVAEEFGVSAKVAAENYSQLAIAARDTALEGDGVKKLFEGITASIRALNLSTQDASLIFNAYTQILAKGKLSAEELRQQLGERFPPAIGVFAKALGVSRAELFELMSRGAILADDILPKVADVLINDFGAAATTGADRYISSVAKVENATFNLSVAMSDAFKGVFALANNLSASTTDFIANRFDLLSKLAGAFLIGITAQAAIGLQVITSMEPIARRLGDVQGFLTRGFGIVARSMAPFLIGIIADVMSDVFGANNSIEQNMTRGVGNMFVAAFSAVDDVMRSFGGQLFNPFSDNTFIDNLKEVGSAVEDFVTSLPGLGPIAGIFIDMNQAAVQFFTTIPSGVIELVALYLMIEQTTTLGKMFVLPLIANLSKAFKGLFKEIQNIIFSKDGIASFFRVLISDSRAATVAMTALGVAAKAAIALLVLSFASGDFSNPLKDSINQAQREMNGAFESIETGLKSLQTTAEQTGGAIAEGLAGALPSKGMELNPLKILGFSDESFKFDDLVEWSNNLDRQILELFNGGREITNNPINIFNRNPEQRRAEFEEVGLGDFYDPTETSETIGQKQLLATAQDIQNQFDEIQARRNEIMGGLTTPDAIAELQNVQVLNAKINNLLSERSSIAIDNTRQSREQVKSLDNRVKQLTKLRDEQIKPFESIFADINAVENLLSTQREAIEEMKDYPPEVRRRLLDLLVPQEEYFRNFRDELKNLGIEEAIAPFEDVWTRVIDKLTDAEDAFRKFKQTAQISNIQDQTGLLQTAATDRELKDSQLNLQESSVRANVEETRKVLAEREAALRQLLSIASVEDAKERADTIQELRDQIQEAELQIAQGDLELARITRERANREKKRLKDIRQLGKDAIDLAEQFESFNQEDNSIERSQRDLNRSIEDFYEQQTRQLEQLTKSYETLTRQIDRQLLETQNTIRSQERELKRLQNRRSVFVSGSGSVANQINNLLSEAESIFEGLFNQNDDLALESLDIEDQNRQLLEQINSGLQQRLDFEKNYARQVEQLAQQQQDLFEQQRQLERDRVRQIREMNDRYQDLEEKAFELGVNLEQTAMEVAQSGRDLTDAIASLANSVAGAEVTPANNRPSANASSVEQNRARAAQLGDDALVLRTLASEATNEGINGKLAVLNVIRNRQQAISQGSATYGTNGGTSMRDVILAPGEFQPVDDGRLFSDFSHEVMQESRKALQLFRDYGDQVFKMYLPSDVHNADAFNVPGTPGADSRITNRANLGGHSFGSFPATAGIPLLDARIAEMQQSTPVAPQIDHAAELNEARQTRLNNDRELMFERAADRARSLIQSAESQLQQIEDRKRDVERINLDSKNEINELVDSVRFPYETLGSNVRRAQADVMREFDGMRRQRADERTRIEREIEGLARTQADREKAIQQHRSDFAQLQQMGASQEVLNDLQRTIDMLEAANRAGIDYLKVAQERLKQNRNETSLLNEFDTQAADQAGQDVLNQAARERDQLRRQTEIDRLDMQANRIDLPFFEADRFLAQADIEAATLEYDRQIESLNELAAQYGIVDTEVRRLSEAYRQIRDIQIANAAIGQDPIQDFLAEGGGAAIADQITRIPDALREASSVMALFGDVGLGVLNTLTNAALDLTASLVQAVLRSMILRALSGGTDPIAGAARVPNFASGYYGNPTALGLGVQAAMSREGDGAFPAVINRNEVVMSAMGGPVSDASTIKRMKKSGTWNRIKAAYNSGMSAIAVPNFRMGSFRDYGATMNATNNNQRTETTYIDNSVNNTFERGDRMGPTGQTDRQKDSKRYKQSLTRVR